MSKRRLGLVFFGMGAALLLAALLLFLHNRFEDIRAGEASYNALTAMQDIIAAGMATTPTQDPLAQQEPVDPTGETTEPAPLELATATIDGHEYIGYLSIPGYELELPVMADWSMEKLSLAVCLQYGSPLTDDAVIAGHNFKHHFRALHDIQEGEYLSFTDMSGYVIEYTVANVTILDPTNVYEVINSEYDLILYTCTSGGQARVVVGCDRVE